ncbi:MAG: sulfatase/phosphatase domain-containing protein, partial [Bacteroidota bacterium]
LLSKLNELELEQNTLVLFCSDNGAARRWEGRFDSSGPLKGRKRDMYEGGIRTPMIAWMPGSIPENTISHTPLYFPDVMPTLANVAGAEVPKNIDGISIWADMQAKDFVIPERYMYWEFYEGGFYQAIRWKDWKGIREGIEGPLELYDLSNDPGETRNISQDNANIVAQLETFLKEARTESPYWSAR